MKVTRDRPIRLSRPTEFEEVVFAVPSRSYYDLERSLEELKLKLHQRETRIEDLEKANVVLKQRLDRAHEVLVLLAHWAPAHPTPIEKTIWVSWVRWAASMPEVNAGRPADQDILLAHGVKTYDTVMDELGIFE